MILRRPPSLQLYASFHPPLQSIALRATRVLLRTGDFGGPSLHHLFFQKLLWMLSSSSQSRKDLRETKTRKPICFWPSSSRQQRTTLPPISHISTFVTTSFFPKNRTAHVPLSSLIHPPKCIHKGTPNNSVVLSRYSYVHNGPSPPRPPFANVSEPSSPRFNAISSRPSSAGRPSRIFEFFYTTHDFPEIREDDSGNRN